MSDIDEDIRRAIRSRDELVPPPLAWGDVCSAGMAQRRRPVHLLVPGMAASIVCLLVGAALVNFAGERPDRQAVTSSDDGLSPLGAPAPVVLPDMTQGALAGVNVLPASPLASRRDASAVWDGSHVLVWGGYTGDPSRADAFADGASYDPNSGEWTSLPLSPLETRHGHLAVWTDAGMLVWGGSSGANGQLLLDGAIYSPDDASWRRVAPAPESAARRQGRIVAVAGGLVVVGGGDDLTGDPSSIVAVYDIRSDTWRTIDLGESVLDMAATPGEGIVALSGSLRGEEIRVVEMDAAALMSAGPGVHRATLSVSGGPSAIGIASSPRTVVVAVKSQRGRLKMREFDLSSWSLTREVSADDTPLQLGTDLLFGRKAMPYVVSDGFVLTASQFGIDKVRLDGTTYERLGADEAHRFCAAPGAAIVWTGSAFIAWGGEGCGSEPTPSTASGASAAVGA